MDQNILSESLRQKRKSLKKSIIATAALMLVTVAIFSAQTYAYFSDSSESEQNRIVAGNLDVEIIEMQEAGEGEIAYVNPVSIMPATSVSKIVRIKNTGSLPVYIRIKIEKSIDKPENEMPDAWEELITCNFKLDDESTPDVIEGLWIYRDGYYYYNGRVEAGSTTSALFDTVFFSADMDNSFANSKISFTVICQSTQANGNSDSPLTAIGWPPETSSGTQTVNSTEQGNASESTN